MNYVQFVQKHSSKGRIEGSRPKAAEDQKVVRTVTTRVASDLGTVQRHRTKPIEFVIVDGQTFLASEKIEVIEYHLIDRVRCYVCGEEIKTDEYGWYETTEEVGEFVITDEPLKTAICHGQCGLDHEYELA